MSTLEICLAISTLLLFAICIIAVVLKSRQAKQISDLTDSINDFIQNGKVIDFSVNDNEFARLQNAVSDLQNLINLEKNNTENEIKKNAQFISDVSHQLKTPIAALRLYCEMENADNPNEHNEKELQLIDRMDKLVLNLLKLEKIRGDAYKLDFKQNEISDIINELVCEFQHLFPKKQYIVSGSSMLRCDRVWLSEAIGNIIKNASEHTADNGLIEITIIDNNKSTIIEIQDNGGGIDESEIGSLFTRFFKTEKSLPSSVGIGMAITKAIVDKHHAIITAENKNQGLYVSMCFPHLDGYITI